WPGRGRRRSADPGNKAPRSGEAAPARRGGARCGGRRSPSESRTPRQSGTPRPCRRRGWGIPGRRRGGSVRISWSNPLLVARAFATCTLVIVGGSGDGADPPALGENGAAGGVAGGITGQQNGGAHRLVGGAEALDGVALGEAETAV